MGSAICNGQLEKVWIAKGYCPTCKKDRYFFREVWEWYGLYDTCLKCGEKYFEGDRMDRPFCPGWRKHNIKKAKQLYRTLKG
jgi:hypothetical protein